MDAATIETRTIPVTVDKSHLVTIGEKLYTEKISFVRELVNNAYDADATEGYVEIAPATVMIRDNGSGMDEAGLRQYFTIGSPLKKSVQESPRFRRTRIGEFGIGKFAALAACARFALHTQRGEFRARMVFDKEAWARHEDWHLDIEVLPAEHGRDGTTVTLHRLNVTLPLGRVRRHLAERTPIHVPDFAVFLNGERVGDEIVAGRRLPVDAPTRFGKITGTIVITPVNQRADQLGLAVCVKGVLVRHETFGMDTSRRLGVARITGKVNADWLPITSGRDDFIRDSEEFTVFADAVRKEIGKALGLVREELDRRANIQASRILKDALGKIGRAMRRRPGVFPDVQVPLGAPARAGDAGSAEGYKISEATFLPTGAAIDPALLERLQEQGKEKGRGRPRGILGTKTVIRVMRVANMEVAVRMEHLGEDQESCVSGGVIYVNLDHPLYRTYRNNDELLTIHISRVITKELALQAGVADARDAFALQGDLLTDAFRGKGV